MNHWAQMLRDLPAIGQRLVARTQRISLPRNAGTDVRLARLRQALCHAATVRAIYWALDPAEQAALQDLRALRGGIRLDDLAQRYGALRGWRQLAADPHPRTIAERLLLLGWLLPRPATPRHPAHYLLPPELRRWLPQPLKLATYGVALEPPAPPAIRAAATILLVCSERPFALRADWTPRRSTIRMLAERLAPLPAADVAQLTSFLLPLLADLGLVATHHGAAAITPAGQRFLALSPAEQRDRLQQAWLTAPRPDGWLMPLLISQIGIDWPSLRQRLYDWAMALPAGQLFDPLALYPALAATFGPLADAQTHGYRDVDRVPWQSRRASAIFEAALRGPLSWLGLVAWTDDRPPLTNGQRPMTNDGWTRQYATRNTQHRAFIFRPSSFTLPPSSSDWRYGQPGEVIVSNANLNADMLHLLPFARWREADDDITTYVITDGGLAHAQRTGSSADALWEVLTRVAGPPPAAWRAALAPPPTCVRLEHTAVIVSEPPVILDRAARSRSVRRYLDARLAPGIALVQPEHVASLTRVLQRQQIAVAQTDMPRCAPPTGLTASECAALLVACAFYRAHAPAEAPLLPRDALEQRLRGALSPSLRTATTRALDELISRPSARLHGSVADAASPPACHEPPSLRADPLPVLRRAIAMRRMVEITYNTAEQGVWTRRAIRPLALDQRDGTWYLSAYCTGRSAERTFRVDRIGSIGMT
jgi:hypothetical protein